MSTPSVYGGLHVQRLESVGPQSPHTPHISHSPPHYPQSTTSGSDSYTHSNQYTWPGKEVRTPTTEPKYYDDRPHSNRQQQYANNSNHDQAPPSRSRRNPFGLSPLAFGALVALITAVIVGGVVGGAVGAVLSSQKSSNSSPSTANPTATVTAQGGAVSTSTSTSTSSSSLSASTSAPTGTFLNYIPPTPPQVQSLYDNCPSVNGSTIVSAQGTYFKISCPQAILGSSGSNGVTLSETVAYTLQDCINACSLMNFWKNSNVCNSVTWDSGMAGATAANFGGNCWLFRDSSTWQVKANSTSARLQT